jgi:hypothetical protein
MPKLSLPLHPAGLLSGLALVDIDVGVSVPRAHGLRRAGLPVSAPVRSRGIVDSGAVVTVIDSTVLQPLGLDSRGTSFILTPSTGITPFVTHEYDVSLTIVFSPLDPRLNQSIESVAVVESDLSALGVGALLGVDILAFYLFSYNGPKDRFGLRF